MNTCRIAKVVSCEGACHTVPSPHVGEGQGEGWRQSTRCEADPVQVRDIESAVIESRIGDTGRCLLYPPPCPSPTWGEGTLWHRSAQWQASIRVCARRCAHAHGASGFASPDACFGQIPKISLRKRDVVAID